MTPEQKRSENQYNKIQNNVKYTPYFMNWASKYYANDKTPNNDDNDDNYGLIESQFDTVGNKNIVKKLFDKIVVGQYMNH